MHDICISLLVAPMFSRGLGYSFQELNGILPKTFLTQASNSLKLFVVFPFEFVSLPHPIEMV